MKVPGRAWLEFQSLPQPGGQTLLSQTAFFEPKGLLGLLYWYVLYPIHSLIFSGLIRRIALQVHQQCEARKTLDRTGKTPTCWDAES
jgi:hypothetical protein